MPGIDAGEDISCEGQKCFSTGSFYAQLNLRFQQLCKALELKAVTHGGLKKA